MPTTTAAKPSIVIRIRVFSIRRIEEDLLDRIDSMLKSGELTHAPPDYWEARKNLERRRRAESRKP